MIAEVYEVKICDSAVDMVHGLFRYVVELYIPNKKMAFNEDSDVFNCFLTTKDRYANATKLGEIEIPKAMLQAMTDYINISKRLGKTKKWYKRCIIKGVYKQSNPDVSHSEIEERKTVSKKTKKK